LRARLLVAAALVVALATMSAAALSTAAVPTRPAPLDSAAFALIAGSDLVEPPPSLSASADSRDPGGVIADFGNPGRTFAPRPQPRLIVVPRVVVGRTPRPVPQVASSGGSSGASGKATWYCKTGVSVCHHAYPGGMYAAAGPRLRVGHWRGRVVQVCGGGTCISVKLIDWCACPGARVIDLYSDAFRLLAPLNKGTMNVTVSW
jgi:hypothetical protein